MCSRKRYQKFVKKILRSKSGYKDLKLNILPSPQKGKFDKKERHFTKMLKILVKFSHLRFYICNKKNMKNSSKKFQGQGHQTLYLAHKVENFIKIKDILQKCLKFYGNFLTPYFIYK